MRSGLVRIPSVWYSAIGVFVFMGVFAVGTQALAEDGPARRFEKPFAKLREIFKSDDAETVTDNLMKSGRGKLFAVEGLARLYMERFPELAELREQSKALEDRVGWLVDAGEHIDFAQQIGAPEKVIVYLKGRQRQARADFARYLREAGFVGKKKPLIERWEQMVSKPKWDEPGKDRAYVLKKLIEITQELRKEQWDMNTLQDGLHDFRRRVRWLLIYTQGLDGLVVLDPRPLERFSGILKDPITKSPYAKLPDSDEDFPILFPKEVFLQLTRAVDILGHAKDMGEAKLEWLPDALVHSGVEPNEAAARELAAQMVTKHPQYVPTFETGKQIMAELRENDERFRKKTDRGPLVAAKKRLRDQIDWTKADCREAMGAL